MEHTEGDHQQGFSPVAEDHAAHPRNLGPMDPCGGHARLTGTCGETMEFWITEREGTLDRATFVTDGCGSSRACGSMATTLAPGKRLEEVLDMRKEEILDAFGGFPKGAEHCAHLAVAVLKAACEDFLKREAAPRARRGRQKEGFVPGGQGISPAGKRREVETEEDFEGRNRLRSRFGRIRRTKATPDAE